MVAVITNHLAVYVLTSVRLRKWDRRGEGDREGGGR